MKFKIIKEDFSICKISEISQVNFSEEFCFIGKTDEEISLVCTTKAVPENTTDREDGFKGFRIQGILDFSLVGILSKISSLLAKNHIGIFAVSTYNTDYIFIRGNDLEKAIAVLEEDGYEIE